MKNMGGTRLTNIVQRRVIFYPEREMKKAPPQREAFRLLVCPLLVVSQARRRFLCTL